MSIITVVAVASRSMPAPQAMPIAAMTQIDAAVKSSHPLTCAAHEDGTCAEEADAGDDIRGDARGIERYVGYSKQVQKAISRDDGEESGTKRDKGEGAHTGRAYYSFALQADHGAK